MSLYNFVTGVQPGIRDTTGRGVRTCARPTNRATLDPIPEQIIVQLQAVCQEVNQEHVTRKTKEAKDSAVLGGSHTLRGQALRPSRPTIPWKAHSSICSQCIVSALALVKNTVEVLKCLNAGLLTCRMQSPDPELLQSRHAPL